MATFTIAEAQRRLRDLPKKVAERGRDIMREEIHDHAYRTGELEQSVRIRENGAGMWSVGPQKKVNGIYLGDIIRTGRRELFPKYAKALKWETEDGEVVFRAHARATTGYDYISATAERLQGEIASGQISL